MGVDGSGGEKMETEMWEWEWESDKVGGRCGCYGVDEDGWKGA